MDMCQDIKCTSEKTLAATACAPNVRVFNMYELVLKKETVKNCPLAATEWQGHRSYMHGAS